MLLRSNFSSFPHCFIYIFLTSGVKLHIHLLNVVVQFIVFFTLSTLIFRSTDISKCFSESLGIRDNGSRLYLDLIKQKVPLNMRKMWRFRSSCKCVKYHFVVSNESVSRQRRSWSECTDDKGPYQTKSLNTISNNWKIIEYKQQSAHHVT